MSLGRTIGAFSLSLALAGPATAAGVIIHKHVAVGGRQQTYALYVPDHPATLPRPLLVLLHGSGGDGSQMIRLWEDRADREGVILLAPDGFQPDAWRMKEDGPQALAAIVAAAMAGQRFDPARIYLFGHSGGAVFALIMAMLESNYFAGVAVDAGSWRDDAEFKLIDIARRKVPIEILIGDRDEFFSTASVRRTRTALQRAGFPIEVVVIKGGRHDYGKENAARINDLAWTFLKSNRLEQAPRLYLYGPANPR